jgi:hypothetical protein
MFQRGMNESLGNEESGNYTCVLQCEDHEQQYKVAHNFQDNWKVIKFYFAYFQCLQGRKPA